jgi:oligopeptide transport system substrate-binding protein
MDRPVLRRRPTTGRKRTRASLALALVLAALPAGARGERVVRLTITNDPPQLDSTKSTDRVSTFIGGHIKEGLTRYGPRGEIVPGVAESWELGDRRAVFRLRAAARWSDGRPVTAHDFVFAWRTVVDPGNASEYAFILYPVKNAEAVNQGKLPPSALGVRAADDRTLVVELERPCAFFLSLTAFKTYQPVREDFHRARPGRYAATAADLLSNGPFVLTRWVHGASLTLERNPRYWDAARVELDRIEIPYITADPNARFNLFEDGRVDLLERIDRDEIRRAEAERLRMRSYSDGGLFFVAFNFRPGRPTRSFHLRKALKLAFDGRAYVSRVVGVPGTRPAAGLVPSWMDGLEAPFHAEYPRPPGRADLAEARRHLALAREELGGEIPPLVWLTGDTPFTGREAEYFQQLLRTELGLSLRIDRQIFKQRLAKMTAGDFDLVSAGWGPDHPDPVTFVDLFASWNENNRGRWSSAPFDALVRRAAELPAGRARLDALAAAERLALGDIALLPLYERTSVYVQSRRLHGVVRRRTGPDPDLTFATVVDEETRWPWSATR